MSERDRNRELVAEAFAAFQRGDVDAVNAGLDPEIEVVISDQLANSGRWTGVDGFWESISTWLEAFDNYELEVRSIDTPDDHHVIVEALQTATGRSSGVPVDLTTYFLLEVHDGISTRHEIHASREDAMAARVGARTERLAAPLSLLHLPAVARRRAVGVSDAVHRSDGKDVAAPADLADRAARCRPRTPRRRARTRSSSSAPTS